MNPKLASIPAMTALFVLASLNLFAGDWVAESNAHTAIVLQAKFAPEQFSSLGIESADKEILDLGSEVFERSQQETLRLIAELEERKRTTGAHRNY